LRSFSGFVLPGFGGTQARLQYRFRTACSFVSQGKIAEQFWQTFQNGYRLLAFQCFGVPENESSISFNKAAMVSGDDLICAIRDNSEGGIVVVVLNKILNWFPSVFFMLRIIA